MKNKAIGKKESQGFSSKRWIGGLLLFFLLLFLPACGKESGYLHDDTSRVDTKRSEEETREEFEAFMKELFVDEVTADTLTLNYTVANPEEYGIGNREITLGDYSLSEMEEDVMESENAIARLMTFDYEKLSEEQKLTYDIVADRLQLGKEAADLLLYTEVLGPTTGIQAQLPILLAEYNFREKEDFDTYIKLLACVPDYFGQIVEFEQEKAEAGLFMSDETADEIISQCKDFVEGEDNYLFTVFEENLEEFEELSEEEKEQYKSQNQQAVKESVIPAYEALMKGLEELKGKGKNEVGLAGLEQGKEYYCHLLKESTGSNREPEEVLELLEERIEDSQKEMARIINETPEAYYTAMDVEFPHKEPEEALSYLEQAILKDFPEIPKVDYRVKYVSPSLEESLSPAFYLTPAIDDYQNHSIYINGASETGSLFTTLAHEGYPGHLYQNTYFQAKEDVIPLRKIININGYSEGWATYVEMYAYGISDIEESAANLLRWNNEASLSLYARTDFGVNYEGWSKEKTTDYLEGYGYEKEDAAMIFQTMVAEPCAYMPYALGYLEIDALREEAEEKLGDRFILKDFHQFILDQGPCPFAIMRDNMLKWMEAANS